MNETMQTIILSILTLVVVPVLVAVVPKLIELAQARIDAEKAKIKDENVRKYVTIAEDAVLTAVGAVAQTMVDGLKKAAADGVLSDQDAREAFEAAKVKALSIMGEAGRDAVRELYGDFDAWLAGKIEFYVGDRKAVV